MNNEEKKVNLHSVQELEQELSRVKYQENYLAVLRSTIFSLITVAAVAVLIAVLLLPVLQIYGSSMTPTLDEGNIVLSVKGNNFKTGDMIAFYYNNKILIKRVIAQPGQWVDMDENGSVYVDGKRINEPYVTEKAMGECDIKLPYQVPESKIFVMGDHRSVSIDSRTQAVGCISEEQIVGKIVFRVWPLKDIGRIR